MGSDPERELARMLRAAGVTARWNSPTVDSPRQTWTLLSSSAVTWTHPTPSSILTFVTSSSRTRRAIEEELNSRGRTATIPHNRRAIIEFVTKKVASRFSIDPDTFILSTEYFSPTMSAWLVRLIDLHHVRYTLGVHTTGTSASVLAIYREEIGPEFVDEV